MAEPSLIVMATAIILVLVRGAMLRLATRWAGKTETRIDDIVIESIRVPSLYWCAAIGLYTGIVLSEIPDKYVSHLSKSIYVIVIISVTITLANLSGRIFRDYLQKTELPIPSTGLAYAY